MGRRPPAFAVRAALQLQMIAPSSPLSHSGSDLQLSEFFISLQSFRPMQAHLTPSPGVASIQTPNERRTQELEREGQLASRPPSNSEILIDELSDIVAAKVNSKLTSFPSGIEGAWLASTALSWMDGNARLSLQFTSCSNSSAGRME